jgi:hypothetical protein
MACGDGIDVRLGGGSGRAHPSPDSGTGGTGVCAGFDCRVDPCVGKAKTSISGTVYDPAGKVPLYNVVVYVPSEKLTEIPTGAACQTCNGYFSGKPLSVALSGPDGRFTLEDVPVGSSIPLVIQVGKWRREVTLSGVAACQNTQILDHDLTRLPRNQSEGHVPKVAIATGASDALECLVRKLGVSDTEFTTEQGPGRVNLFAGYGASATMADGTRLTLADTLWGDATLLNGYDMMLLSCEGSDNIARTDTAYANVRHFADIGGRIFGSHWHHGWINPDKPTKGAYPVVMNLSEGAHGFTPPEVPITVSIDTSFPKGQAFSEWLLNVGASTTLGLIDIRGAEHSVDSVVDGVAQRWIYGTDTQKNTPMVQYFSFNTPIGKEECGRMVFSDVHVSAGAGTDGGKDPFPNGCVTQDLSPQEKALEFMIFDLSSCVQPDTALVNPP